MLRNSEVTVGGLQIFSASKAAVVEQSKTTMDSSSDVQLYLDKRLKLVAQQGSSDRYSYSGTYSHKSCVSQGDPWVIKLGWA